MASTSLRVVTVPPWPQEAADWCSVDKGPGGVPNQCYGRCLQTGLNPEGSSPSNTEDCLPPVEYVTGFQRLNIANKYCHMGNQALTKHFRNVWQEFF